jgi:ferredoxin
MSTSVSPKKQNNGLVWGATAVISLAALTGIVILLVRWNLSVMDSINTVVVGGIVWVAIFLALREIRVRLKTAPVVGLLRKPNDWPITILVVLLMAMGFFALWEVQTDQKTESYPLRQVGIAGALVAIAGGAILWAREATKPIYEVTIVNDHNKVYMISGSRLMQTLKANGYELFAQCGGKGTCATCRCKIPAGLPEEKRAPTMYGPLNEKLRGEGWILSCQIAVNSDMTIELFKPLVKKWPPLAITTPPATGAPTAPSKPATPAT